MRLHLCILLSLVAWLSWGCPKQPPTKNYQDALAALEAAKREMADKCAKDELASAERMIEQAKKLMDEGKYDLARDTFDAAKKLAEKAAEESKSNREECLKRIAAANQPPPRDTTPAVPNVISSTEVPVPDNRESLEPIYFGFNQYSLSPETKQQLQKHAEWIRRHSDAKVQIEGHCDQRGSVEYNLALGERRAIAVRQYLLKLGIPAERVSVISYGHQRPSDPRMTDEAYTKNRRAEFKVSR